jgi:hypothetical protein
VPITYNPGGLSRLSVEELRGVAEDIREQRGSLDGFDLAIWAEVATDPAAVADEIPAYEQVGATWWIETAHPGRDPEWLATLTTRVARGV